MIETLDSESRMEEALSAEVCVVYKHSPSCAVSAVANTQIDRFASEHPDTPVYRLDVVDHKDIALAIAERLQVRHQSPQAILLRRGEPVWRGAHYGIRATRMAIKLDETA